MIPMLMAGRFARPRAKTARRSKVWVGAQSATATGLGPSSAVVFTVIAEADLETQGKPTIARVRGTWNAWYDRAAAPATGAMIVGAGITLVSTKSVTAGIASLPQPLTNIEWPWLWWDTTIVGLDFGDATGFQLLENSVRVVDSKAMRKVPPGNTLVLIVETSPALLGAPDTRFGFSIRILLMPS